jgi:hypothetical protein
MWNPLTRMILKMSIHLEVDIKNCLPTSISGGVYNVHRSEYYNDVSGDDDGSHLNECIENYDKVQNNNANDTGGDEVHVLYMNKLTTFVENSNKCP